MRIIFDEDDAALVAKALAKSRGIACDFEQPFEPGSLTDQIYNEGLRVVAAFKLKYEHPNAN